MWLGATDDAKSKVEGASEGNWVWADGQVLSFEGWGAVEPDNYAGKQHYMGMGLADWPRGTDPEFAYGLAGQWNDVSGTNKLFYVVEWPLSV